MSAQVGLQFGANRVVDRTFAGRFGEALDPGTGSRRGCGRSRREGPGGTRRLLDSPHASAGSPTSTCSLPGSCSTRCCAAARIRTRGGEHDRYRSTPPPERSPRRARRRADRRVLVSAPVCDGRGHAAGPRRRLEGRPGGGPVGHCRSRTLAFEAVPSPAVSVSVSAAFLLPGQRPASRSPSNPGRITGSASCDAPVHRAAP